MSLVGRFHPLLVHFPIALVLAAAGAELGASLTRRASWRTVAVVNLRAGAAMTVLTMIAGLVLATASFVEATPSLTLHKWTGLIAAVVTVAAALASRRAELEAPSSVMVYRSALFAAAALVALAAHLGAALVWGPDFLTR